MLGTISDAMDVQSLRPLSECLLSVACLGAAASIYRLVTDRFVASEPASLKTLRKRVAKPATASAIASQSTDRTVLRPAQPKLAASKNDSNATLPAALSEAIFQQAIACTDSGLLICDAREPDLPIVYASPSFEQLTGYQASEVLGKNCRFLQNEETDQLGAREIRSAIANGTGCKVLLRNYRKSGQPFWSEVTLSPLFDELGTVTHYVGTQVDVSQHLDTFKALQQSEMRYRHLYEETPAMMHSVDAAGRITSMSHYWLEKLGYDRKEVISQPLAAFLTEDSSQRIEQILTTLEFQKVDRNRYCRFVKKNGEPMDVLLSTMAECSDNPRAGSTLGVLVDVTERRKAKEKLRRSEALLRAINNLPPTGIFVMDLQTSEALFINDEFYRIWQLEHLKADVESGQLNAEQLLTECLSNIDLGRFVAASTDEDFTHGNKIVEDEVPLLDGRTLRRIYGPIQENKTTFASLYIFEDITERKQAVQKLAYATQQAEAANRAKSEFLANMSHELRSPLNAILGFTHILQQECLTPTQQENLEIIYNSSEHLLALINDILDISKIEAGRVALNIIEFDLHRLLDELQQMFSSAVTEKNIELEIVRSPKTPRIICSDRLKLRQILINLLSNAVKFTAAGKITLSVEVSSSQTSSQQVDTIGQNHSESTLESLTLLEFSVADTGSGIALADQEKLFEAFVQTQSALTAQQGTGLGLTISQEYVQLLGGTLNVHSTLGEGSTFDFSIAVRALENCASQSEAANPLQDKVIGLAPHEPNRKILVVDDVALNRKLLTHVLRGVGFDVKEACDGKEAIAQWQSWRPHLVWMDIRMPVMGGEEAALRIKSFDTQNQTRIIALTANAFDDDRTAALANGCDDFVSKPIRANTILDKAAKHLGVRYQYASTNNSQKAAPAPVSADLFEQTEASWRYELTQAILDLDDDRILALAEQLPLAQDTLKRAITAQVKKLAYKTLFQVLQEAEAVIS